MTTHQLESLIEELRAEREALGADAEAHQERLDALAAELQHCLEHPREDNQDEELLEAVRDAIQHFEVEHPRITGVLNNLMVTLSNMGI